VRAAQTKRVSARIIVDAGSSRHRQMAAAAGNLGDKLIEVGPPQEVCTRPFPATCPPTKLGDQEPFADCLLQSPASGNPPFFSKRQVTFLYRIDILRYLNQKSLARKRFIETSCDRPA